MAIEPKLGIIGAGPIGNLHVQLLRTIGFASAPGVVRVLAMGT